MERGGATKGYGSSFTAFWRATMTEATETTFDDGISMSDQAKPRKRATGGAKSGIRGAVKEKLVQHGGELRGQAQAKAREYAEQGKAKATDTLYGVSRFFDDTARALDDQLGSDLGGYVHRAADAVAGFTDALKQKDVEELLGEARDAVRRNPALAIGAAAAAGFVLMRLIKSATPTETAAATKPRASRARTGKTPSADDINVG
jgi:ElaB/YqjD/DUF883 family membrane-anchored ribosome-binding protein